MVEQEKMLRDAKEKLREVLAVNATILVPPRFKYNNDTLLAMRRAGYDVVSCSYEYARPSAISDGVVSIPATVLISNLINGTWRMKSTETLYSEVFSSVGRYGYAVILTHPQEYVRDGKQNQEALAVYQDLMRRIEIVFSFTTLEELRSKIIS